MSSLDTTPNYPPQPEAAVERAARDLPSALRGMPNEAGFGAPRQGGREVLAQRLVETLARRGHSPGAAAWAVHRLVRLGLLLADAAAAAESPAAGRGRADPPGRRLPADGGPGQPPAPPGRPVPYDRLLVRATPALWRLPSDNAPAAPQFGEADFGRALSALDLTLQDYTWKPGDNRLISASLFGALQAKGVTLALADALLRRLIGMGVFTPWSHTIPAGSRNEPGSPLPVHRIEPETTHCLVTTRERWYGYLAARKDGADGGDANDAAAPPPGRSSAARVPRTQGPAAGRKGRTAARGGRDRKQEARDQWIYRQCCMGRDMPHGKIVAELKKVAAAKGWQIVSSKERIRQIGVEYADRHGRPRPPSRQNL